jgi:oligopeptidase B
MRINYQSPVTPSTVMEVDLASGQQSSEAAGSTGGYDASRYEARRIWVTARVGACTGLGRDEKGVELNGKAPLLLYAYAATVFRWNHRSRWPDSVC